MELIFCLAPAQTEPRPTASRKDRTEDEFEFEDDYD